MRLITRNRLKVVSKTTTYQCTTDDDVVLCSDAGGSFTVTLPPIANAVNKVMWFKKTNDSANLVTIDGSGAEVIDDGASVGLFLKDDSLGVFCDGAKWRALERPAGGILLLTQVYDAGSTNTRIPRFLTTTTNTAALDLTYADTAANGMSVTIVQSGLYFVRFESSPNVAASTGFGISVNSNQLTTALTSITLAHRKAVSTIMSTYVARNTAVTTLPLRVGDVVRAHLDNAYGDYGGTNDNFLMQRIR